MKKSIIAVSLATAFSLPAFADINIQNPIEGTPSNPIELPNPAQPIEQTPTQPQLPVQPILPEPSNPIEHTPTQPQLPVQPTLPDPSHPIELPKPTQPIEHTPTQPPVDNTPDRPHPPIPTQPPVDNTPDRPHPPIPTQPPVDNTPDRPQPQVPSNPIEGDDVDVPDISGPSESQRISAAEMNLTAMAEEYNGRFNNHEEQMDGIRASLHAVTNARPFVTNGEFAIGAGVGFAGSKEALALGGAYGINESLSVSGTFHYETSGKYSSSDVAGGVGLQYNFK